VGIATTNDANYEAMNEGNEVKQPHKTLIQSTKFGEAYPIEGTETGMYPVN